MALPAIIPALLGTGGGAGGAASALGGLLGSQGLQQAGSKLTGITNQFQQLNTSLGRATPSFSGFLKVLTAAPAKILEIKNQIVSAVQVYVDALAAPIDAVAELGNSIGRFVRLASPSTFERFTYSVENTFATIGRSLEPLMRKLTDAANKLGNIYARVAPAIAPAIKAIEMLIDMGLERLAVVAEALAPGIYRFSLLFLGLVKVFDMIQRPINAVIRLFGQLQRFINQVLGIGAGYDPDAKQARAVRDVSIIGTEDIQRRAAADSIKASIGGPDKDDQARDATISLPQILENIRTAILGLPAEVIKFIIEKLPVLASAIGEAIRDNLPGKEARQAAGNVRDKLLEGDFSGAYDEGKKFARQKLME